MANPSVPFFSCRFRASPLDDDSRALFSLLREMSPRPLLPFFLTREDKRKLPWASLPKKVRTASFVGRRDLILSKPDASSLLKIRTYCLRPIWIQCFQSRSPCLGESNPLDFLSSCRQFLRLLCGKGTTSFPPLAGLEPFFPLREDLAFVTSPHVLVFANFPHRLMRGSSSSLAELQLFFSPPRNQPQNCSAHPFRRSPRVAFSRLNLPSIEMSTQKPRELTKRVTLFPLDE